MSERAVLDIVDLGYKGEGIGRHHNLAVFVPDAIPGDRVEVEITDRKKRYARGRLVKIVDPSPQRVEAPCPLFAACGGCQLQHMDYRAQLTFKTRRVKDAIERIGGLDAVEIRDTLGMDEPFRYRNKAQYPVGIQGDAAVLGFYRRGTHDIVDVDACLIQDSRNDQVAQAVREILRETGVEPYDEKSGRGVLRHLVVRTSLATRAVYVVFVTNGPELPAKDRFIQGLLEAVPNISGIAQNINTARTNVIMGPTTQTLWGKSHLIESVAGLKFALSPRSFFQVNPRQTEILYRQALADADLRGDEDVVDLYCGIGTMTLLFAEKCRHAVGIEIVPEAVEDARGNAALNDIKNADFIEAKVEEALPRLVFQGRVPDVVILDPPRKGCEAEVLEALAKAATRRLVYVSCDPGTLARDLKWLHEHEYEVIEVQPVDMFPHTAHVETVTLLTRR